MMTIKKLTVVALAAVTLAGCANKDAMIPRPEKNMTAVYQQAMGASNQGRLMDERAVLRRGMVESDSDYSDYVRTEANQLQSKFSLLPNPTMYMFVAPHLATADGVPVPGYLTEFRLYKEDVYALPGEKLLSNGL
mgnify:CR=1 FL=1